MRIFGLMMIQASNFLWTRNFHSTCVLIGNNSDLTEINFPRKLERFPLKDCDYNYGTQSNPKVEIKRLEEEKKRLEEDLSKQKELNIALMKDLRLIDATRRSCMIYELYQRFRLNLARDLEGKGIIQDGKRLEVFLDEVRKGKVFPNEKIVYWLADFEITPEVVALKVFRNDFAHHTITDIEILRQWLNEILENPSLQEAQISSASINILNMIIGHLSRPKAQPLQKKYHKVQKVNVKEESIVDKKKKIKKERRARYDETDSE